ncbi:PTS sugar transporter subunit IIA [Hippea jasoniae]|uniref:PTS sugar transporter subunit IIA n=1 Tax=Hippea jasoniae TaxID=944479 RepID=UPI00055843BB|nr:PTS sugar transporter subunit IIA [Hippea jasoniae]
MKDYRISNFIKTVELNIDCSDKEECLKKMAHVLSKENGLNEDEIFALLRARERFGSTAIGDYFAMPHAKMDSIDSLIGGIFTTKQPIDFGSLDGMPSQIFFVILAPAIKPSILLKAVAKAAKIFKDAKLKERIIQAKDKEEVMDIIIEKENQLKA